MKENSDNKSLIKVNDNIFSKIRNWFINLFSAKTKNIENNIDVADSNIDISKSDNKNDFLNSIKASENGDTKIFNLQRQYESGELTVKDMSKEEYLKIEELYNRQIENLTNQIKVKKAKLSTN